MPQSGTRRGAHRKVAPFAFLALVFAAPLWAAPLCPADHLDEEAQVAYVYDGDTVRLEDGRNVRVIGFDAPEVAHGDHPSQPFGDQARSVLDASLKGKRIGLRYDAERQDRYSRTLAHVYLADGNALAAVMLAKGLGSVLSVPPNVWNQECYRAQEAGAEHGNKGVWGLPAYRGVDADFLTLADEGFHRVFGKVIRVGDGPKSVRIQLDGLLTVRIPRDALSNFPYDLHTLLGRRVLARGRIYADGRQLLLTIHDGTGIQPLVH
jgi:micrococcal nuclease